MDGYPDPIIPEDASGSGQLPDGVMIPTDPDPSAIRGHPHPMHNQVVLSHFFNLRPSDLLANCRLSLVCKEWNRLSLFRWRRSTAPRLIYEKELISFYYSDPDFGPIAKQFLAEHADILRILNGNLNALRALNENAGNNPEGEAEEDQAPTELGVMNSIQEFVEVLEDPEHKYLRTPHRRFVLKLWKFQDPRLQRFWQSVGTHITGLFLYKCTFDFAEEFRGVIFTSCPNLEILAVVFCKFYVIDPANLLEGHQYVEPVYGRHPKLRKLKMETWDWNEEWCQLPISWLELLSHFEELKELRIYWDETTDDVPEVHKALRAINSIRNHDMSKLPIEWFDFGEIVVSNESANMFQLLHTLRLPLETLSISLEPDLDNGLIRRILEHCVRTVSKLYIWGTNGPSFPLGLSTETWNNLRTMQIPGDLCQSLEFLSCTPNLTRLSVTCDILEWEAGQFRETSIIRNTSKERMASVRLPNLTSFHLDYLVSEEDLRCLILWIPNLESFALVMNHALFAMVCEYWRNLTCLRVLGDAVTEEGIMGRVQPKQDQVLESEKDVLPNITYLKALKELHVSRVKLTEFSVIHGLVKLPELCRLRFDASSEIGAEGLEALRAKNVHYFKEGQWLLYDSDQ